MGWLVAAGILILLAILPLGVLIRYDTDGVVVKAAAGPVRVTLMPRKKKPKKDKKKKTGKKTDQEADTKPASAAEPKNTEKDPQRKDGKPGEKKAGGSLTDFMPLVKLTLNLLGDFRRKLRVDCLEAKIILAGDDPCDLALNYSRAWAAVGNLLPQLERVFIIKKRKIEVECDFVAESTLLTARLDISITLGRLLALAAVYGVHGLIELIKLNNKRKGGAVNEQKST